MRLRSYHPADREAVLAVFRSNVPSSFTAAEEPDFLRFVDEAHGPYFLVEREGRVVACGGIAETDGRVDLCWGMVERALHRQGIGLALTAFRLCLACAMPTARELHLNTSNEMLGFYTRLGFGVDRLEKDAIRPGLDLVYLHRVLDTQTRQQVREELEPLVRARLEVDAETWGQTGTGPACSPHPGGHFPAPT